MNNPTLQYYMHDGPGAFRFELAGRLNRKGRADSIRTGARPRR